MLLTIAGELGSDPSLALGRLTRAQATQRPLLLQFRTPGIDFRGVRDAGAYPRLRDRHSRQFH